VTEILGVPAAIKQPLKLLHGMIYMIQVVSFATVGCWTSAGAGQVDRHHSSDACMRTATGVAGMLLRAR